MYDIMNEAIRKLYLACKQNSCFPGPLPKATDTDDENVSIHTILQCLGLIENMPDLKDPGEISEDKGRFNLVLDPFHQEQTEVKSVIHPELTAGSNGSGLSQEYREKLWGDIEDKAGVTKDTSSRALILTSTSIVIDPFSALTDNTMVSSFGSVFPHSLDTYFVASMDQYADHNNELDTQPSHDSELQKSLPQPTKIMSYLTERDEFYRNLSNSSIYRQDYPALIGNPLQYAWESLI
jgi:hypothetical protein